MANGTSPAVTEIKTEVELRNQCNSSKLLVLEFMSPSNVPCMNMKSTIEQMARTWENVSFFTLDVDKFKDLAWWLDVDTVPTFVLVKNRYVQDTVVGVNKRQLEDRVIKALSK